jgi:hypothetical protein
MKQRGRRSAASLATRAVDGRSPRLKPPPSLNEDEHKIFVDLVATTDADHFVASDLPVLVVYCRAIAMEQWAAARLRKAPDGKWLAVWERAARTVTVLSAKLRLCPQSRRQYAKPGPPPGPKPWEIVGRQRKPWDIVE